MADNETEPEKVPSMDGPDSSRSNPSYPEMIMAAVRALDEPSGSSKAAISKYMAMNYPNVSSSNSTVLLHHLRLLKEGGSLVMDKHCYKLPSESQGSEPNSAPVKRGRGRPPKPKIGVPTTGLPRPRGRPPKPKIGVPAVGPPRPRGRPPKPKVGVPASGSPRPRGRPPKPKIGVPAAGSPRPRGRPPKPKVGVLSPVGPPRSRGRPPKKPKVGVEATGAPRPRGRPRKLGGTASVPTGGTPRPRGRPPKPKDPTKPSVSPSPKGSRPRGRPPKAKPAEVPAAVEVPTSLPAAITPEVPLAQ
ncbi:HMG-Y-related protein A-like [Nymphaea colorata]|nr:HMG-Y-related protein A-like [Nymphaea colorata]